MYPTSRVYSPLQSPLCLLTHIKLGIGFSHSGAPISFSQPFSIVSLTKCGLMRRVIHKPAAASRAVSGALSMALVRKYSGFNLYSAVPVPTQSSAVLVERPEIESGCFSACKADNHPLQSHGPYLFRHENLVLGIVAIISQSYLSVTNGTENY